jgi:hypothetical protein
VPGFEQQSEIKKLDLLTSVRDSHLNKNSKKKDRNVSFDLDSLDTSSIGSNESTHYITLEKPQPIKKVDMKVDTKERDLKYDQMIEKKRAYQFLQLNYPANTKNDTLVLSFMFGIIPIVKASLGLLCREFDMLKLVLDHVLLNSCVEHVKAILIDKHTVEEYLGSQLSLAFDLLRDKHVVSVISKVLLLPLIICLFPKVLVVASVMKALSKGKYVDVMVLVECYGTIGELQFNDFVRVDPVAANNNMQIDYFV